MVNNKSFKVAAIRNGTVIDHITSRNALKIMHLLNLAKHNKQVLLGLNLPSHTLKCKDLIKVEDREFTPEEANKVAIFAPQATINIINEYKVTKKFQVSLPEKISGIIDCPNPTCVTNYENNQSSFTVKQRKNHIQLQCKYCRKSFTLE